MRGNQVTRYAVLAVVAAVVTIGLKGTAWRMTGSVAILSDALESFVNLATSLISLMVLIVAARPPDEEHSYGHTKVEYFASGFEGAMILIAAASIGYAAVLRLLSPMEIVAVRDGLAVTVAASVVNLVAAQLLFRAEARTASIALGAGARHLMVDVWTSVAVVIGVILTAATGIARLDPIFAIAVAINIVRTGVELIRRSMLGLMDTALPEDVRERITRILEEHRPPGTQYHAIRTRQAGNWRFISFHMLVPGEWSVQTGHDLLERIEEKVREGVPNSTVFTHLEPIEDPLSWQDTELHRT